MKGPHILFLVPGIPVQAMVKGVFYDMEIQLWKEILDPYDLAVKELIVKFEHLMQEHREKDCTAP